MICHQDLLVIGIWNKQIGFFFSTQQQNLNLKPNTLKNSNSFNCYSFSHFRKGTKMKHPPFGKKNLLFCFKISIFQDKNWLTKNNFCFLNFNFFFTNFQNSNFLPKDGLTRKVKQRWNWMIRYEHNRVRPKLGFETLLFQNFGCIKFVKSIFKLKTSNL